MFKLASQSLVIVLLYVITANAQYLQYPESVVYDSLNGRYLVSNWNSGNLVQIDSSGTQSRFLTSARCYAGLWIVGNEIYSAAKDEGVMGYNLHTGEQVMNLSIPDTELLNDIVADSSGNLYLSDPRVHKIIRVNIATQEWSYYVENGINTPNGMAFDPEHNRIILVSSRENSPIQAISLEDSSVTTIINTPIDIMDGITRDDDGYYYISSWGTSTVYRFDSNFTYPPDIFSTHDEQPADIFFDRVNSILAVPIFYYHRVDFMPVEQTYVYNDLETLPEYVTLKQNYPNPFNASTIISFTLPDTRQVNLSIYNIQGQTVEKLADGFMAAGEHNFIWNASNYPSGVYFARLFINDAAETVRMILLK